MSLMGAEEFRACRNACIKTEENRAKAKSMEGQEKTDNVSKLTSEGFKEIINDVDGLEL